MRHAAAVLPERRRQQRITELIRRVIGARKLANTAMTIITTTYTSPTTAPLLRLK
jgi:hypothetical protein